MKTFKLTCNVTVSAYTEVQAETLDAAIAAAGSRDVELGGIGRGVYENESWVIDEADGAPIGIKSAE